jgi:hypothetical protein
LANFYMRRFVLAWKKLGLQRSLGSRIVTYADALVILCKQGKAEEALLQLRAIMGKLKLTVNEEKTQICKVPEGEFEQSVPGRRSFFCRTYDHTAAATCLPRFFFDALACISPTDASTLPRGALAAPFRCQGRPP